jgi:hypothetical protein
MTPSAPIGQRSPEVAPAALATPILLVGGSIEEGDSMAMMTTVGTSALAAAVTFGISGTAPAADAP